MQLSIHGWEALDPIEEVDFMAGDPQYPTKEFLREDYVLLSATATDRDRLLLQCVPWLSPCAPSPEVALDISDTLTYWWGSSPGTIEAQFPAGNTAREVVFSTKGIEAAQVTIWVEVGGLGLQYPDEVRVVMRTFPIVGSQRTIDAGLIATVSSLEANPTKAQEPPHASAGQSFAATRLAESFYGNSWAMSKTIRHVFKPSTRPDGWYARGERVIGPSPVFALHYPWRAAFEIVRHSGNPPPEPAYPDLSSLRAWAQSGAPGGVEHRGVYGVHMAALQRRDVLLEFPDPASQHLDLLVGHGWTPMTRGEVVGIARFALSTFELGGSYERGQAENQSIRMAGECSESISFFLTVDFQVSSKGAKLAEWMTNRTPPWIHCNFTALLNADGSGNVSHNGWPSFPTYDLYLGTGGNEMLGVQHKEQIPIINYINLGDHVDETGL